MRIYADHAATTQLAQCLTTVFFCERAEKSGERGKGDNRLLHRRIVR